jgi:hypothetical protein
MTSEGLMMTGEGLAMTGERLVMTAVHFFSKLDQEVSLVPPMPWTRNANSAGLDA